MAAAFCVDCGLQLTGRYCGACGGSSIGSAIQKMSCRDCGRHLDLAPTSAGLRSVGAVMASVLSVAKLKEIITAVPSSVIWNSSLGVLRNLLRSVGAVMESVLCVAKL
jgi:hypothetical protein